jgi:ABC-type sulfate transport system permease component
MAWYEDYFIAGAIAALIVLVLVFILAFVLEKSKNDKVKRFVDIIFDFLFRIDI